MSTAIFAAQSYLDDALYANTGDGSDSYPTKERGQLPYCLTGQLLLIVD